MMGSPPGPSNWYEQARVMQIADTAGAVSVTVPAAEPAHLVVLGRRFRCLGRLHWWQPS